MKKLILLTQCIFVALSSFALSETVGGVTWNYYVKDGRAILEYPNLRKMSSPKEVHDGTLPRELFIPSSLGGCPVSIIGQFALRLSESGRVPDVDLVVIPESVAEIGDMSFTGSCIAWHKQANSYLHGWAHLGYLEPTPEIFFLGAPPAQTNLSHSWVYKQGTNIADDWRSSNIFEYSYGTSIAQQPFYGCACYVIEGVEGWAEDINYWFGGTVKFGAAKVEIVPTEKVLGTSQPVILSCKNRTAKIYYTLDGSDPTTNQTANCFLYEGPFSITHRTQVKALAYVAEYPYQVVYSNEYAFGQTATPIMTAVDGEVFNWSGNVVTLSCETGDVEIRYTLDGSEPTERSLLYTAPFAIDDTTTVKAKALKEDWFESETATATFTREWYTVATPIIEPSSMTYENVSQVVSISCATDGATILYTTDGSDPAVNGREYKHSFDIYQSCTVRAIARKYDWKDSPEATATFTRSDSLSEAANLYDYTMETDGDAAWTVDTDVSHDSVSSVRSGAIDNDGTTYLQTSVRKAGTVSFWWKAMCEEAEVEDGEMYYYDFGSFSVDGDVKARIAGNDTGWQFVSVDVPSGGKHTLRWAYAKDDSTSYAPDCVWLDQVQWTPADGSGFTMTTPEQVPYSWLSKYGFGGEEADFETAAKLPSGKRDGSGNALSIWQEYVAGTDPTNETSRFTAKIEMRDGVPIVTWEPDLNEEGTKSERLYKVYGRESLDVDSPWQYPTNSLHRFFKVTVDMP